MLEFPSFSRLNNTPLRIHGILFIHSFVLIVGNLGCFCCSVMVNNAAVSSGVQIPLRDPTFSSFQ